LGFGAKVAIAIALGLSFAVAWTLLSWTSTSQQISAERSSFAADIASPPPAVHNRSTSGAGHAHRRPRPASHGHKKRHPSPSRSHSHRLNATASPDAVAEKDDHAELVPVAEQEPKKQEQELESEPEQDMEMEPEQDMEMDTGTMEARHLRRRKKRKHRSWNWKTNLMRVMMRRMPTQPSGRLLQRRRESYRLYSARARIITGSSAAPRVATTTFLALILMGTGARSTMSAAAPGHR
jgi:hypothetical protein